MASELDRILDPGYLGDLASLPMNDVRAMRAECQEVETGLSYLRRLVQGRLDIVGVERQRRRDGGEPGELSALDRAAARDPRGPHPGARRRPAAAAARARRARRRSRAAVRRRSSPATTSTRCPTSRTTQLAHAARRARSARTRRVRLPPPALRPHRRAAGRDHPPLPDGRGLGRVAPAVTRPRRARDRLAAARDRRVPSESWSPTSRRGCVTSASSSVSSGGSGTSRCASSPRWPGISNPYLSQIERGLRKPSAEILQQIARALEISRRDALRAGRHPRRRATATPTSSREIRRDPRITEDQKKTLDPASTSRSGTRTADGPTRRAGPTTRNLTASR